MEGENNYEYDRDDMANHGYQEQAFSEDGELTAIEEEEMEDFDELDMDFEDDNE